MNILRYAIAAALFFTLTLGGVFGMTLAAKYLEKRFINPMVYCNEATDGESNEN